LDTTNFEEAMTTSIEELVIHSKNPLDQESSPSSATTTYPINSSYTSILEVDNDHEVSPSQ